MTTTKAIVDRCKLGYEPSHLDLYDQVVLLRREVRKFAMERKTTTKERDRQDENEALLIFQRHYPHYPALGQRLPREQVEFKVRIVRAIKAGISVGRRNQEGRKA